MLYSQEQTGEPIGLSLRLIRIRLQALHDFPYSVFRQAGHLYHIIHGDFHRQQIRHNLAVTLVGALSAPLQKSVFTSLDIPIIVACLKNTALVTQGFHVADIVLPVGGTQGINA